MSGSLIHGLDLHFRLRLSPYNWEDNVILRWWMDNGCPRTEIRSIFRIIPSMAVPIDNNQLIKAILVMDELGDKKGDLTKKLPAASKASRTFWLRSVSILLILLISTSIIMHFRNPEFVPLMIVLGILAIVTLFGFAEIIYLWRVIFRLNIHHELRINWYIVGFVPLMIISATMLYSLVRYMHRLGELSLLLLVIIIPVLAWLFLSILAIQMLILERAIIEKRTGAT
jgi:hypothetical protein